MLVFPVSLLLYDFFTYGNFPKMDVVELYQLT